MSIQIIAKDIKKSIFKNAKILFVGFAVAAVALSSPNAEASSKINWKTAAIAVGTTAAVTAIFKGTDAGTNVAGKITGDLAGRAVKQAGSEELKGKDNVSRGILNGAVNTMSKEIDNGITNAISVGDAAKKVVAKGQGGLSQGWKTVMGSSGSNNNDGGVKKVAEEKFALNKVSDAHLNRAFDNLVSQLRKAKTVEQYNETKDALAMVSNEKIRRGDNPDMVQNTFNAVTRQAENVLGM